MLEFAPIFQSGMTLQRRKSIRLWGECYPTQAVEVKLNGRLLMSTGLVEGRFELQLPAMEAMEDITLTITGSTGVQVCFEGVDIGEVWVAGGQSNMEFPLEYDEEGGAMMAAANDPHLRFYNTAQWAFAGEEREGLKDASAWNRWMDYTPENAGLFSAVGAYFALKVKESLGVPVAIVGCNWSGTTAAAWLDPVWLKNDPDLKVYCDEYEKSTARLDLPLYLEQNRRRRAAASSPSEIKAAIARYRSTPSETESAQTAEMLAQFEMAAPEPLGPHSEGRPGGLFDTMVKRIAGYTCRGVIWYQGESDAERYSLYEKLFSAVIQCWRKRWSEPELPFLFVQLAPFATWLACTGDLYPDLRAAQE